MKLSARGILKAEGSSFLNSARNGTTKARQRRRRPLRLPEELWEKIDGVADELGIVFPNRFISSNSTIEFLIEEGLSSITSSKSTTFPTSLSEED